MTIAKLLLSALLIGFDAAKAYGSDSYDQHPSRQTCRMQGVDVLYIEKSDEIEPTSYDAALRITISFAVNEFDPTFDMASNLRIFGGRKALEFEHFQQQQQLTHGYSIVVKTTVPLSSKSIDVVFKKDDILNYCGEPEKLVLDKQDCIDVADAQLVALPKSKYDDRIIPGNHLFMLSVRLKASESELATTNVRLPPSSQIELKVTTDEEILDVSDLKPTEVTTEKSHSLTYHGVVSVPTSDYYNPYVYIDAFDTKTAKRSCGNFFYGGRHVVSLPGRSYNGGIIIFFRRKNVRR